MDSLAPEKPLPLQVMTKSGNGPGSWRDLGGEHHKITGGEDLFIQKLEARGVRKVICVNIRIATDVRQGILDAVVVSQELKTSRNEGECVKDARVTETVKSGGR